MHAFIDPPIVHETTTNHSDEESSNTMITPVDQDDTTIGKCLESSCGCTLRNNGACSTAFTLEYLRKMRQDCNQFTRKELDLILLGQIAACLDNRDTTSTRSEHKA